MTKAPIHTEEMIARQLASPSRLRTMRALGLLDVPPDTTFIRLVELATRVLDVPSAVITLVEPARQFFLAESGVGEPWASQRETPISHSFCKYVVGTEQELVVENAREHPVVRDNPAIDDLNVVAYAGTPLRLSNGDVLGSFCAIDDHPRHWTDDQLDLLRTLTEAAMAELELRLANRELRERETRFRGALERVRALAVTLDTQARLTFVNDYFLEVTGWTREELLGEDWFSIVPVGESERQARRQVIADGTFESRNDGLLVTRAGEQRMVSWDNIPLRDADGRITGVAGIGHDVTLERQAAQLKNELIGIVSHELRGPLTAIRTGLRMVEPQRESLDARGQRMVDIAIRNCDRLVRLVTDLLDLERIESGAMPMHRAPVTVRTLIDAACEETTPIAEAAGVTVAIDCGCEAVLDVDADRVVQALTNLIRNAISFSPAGAAIAVSAQRRDAAWVTLEVRDHGPGIAPDDLSRIFERFRQARTSDSRERVGTGLGLAITRAIVEQLGGQITVESEVGQGSVFRMTLPAVSAVPASVV